MKSGGALHIDRETARTLLDHFGPSLALWRAAEVAALRTVRCDAPILDLGCGDGIVTSLAFPHVEVGIDPDKVALARARGMGGYRQLIPRTMEAATVPPGSIGTVVSNSVLEHVPGIEVALSAAARALRPGGRLVFTTPSEAFSGSLLLPATPYTRWRNQRLQHRHLWSPRRWTAVLRAAGMELVVVRPYLRPPLVRAWDLLDLAEGLWVGRRRVFSLLWDRVPASGLDRLARWISALDLSSPPPGGGQLIVARKP